MQSPTRSVKVVPLVAHHSTSGINMASKIPSNLNAMSLKRFMLRSQVLKLYRDMLRMVYKIPDKSQRLRLQQFIRHDFDSNKHVQDEETIKMLLTKGKMSLRELESTVMLAR